MVGMTQSELISVFNIFRHELGQLTSGLDLLRVRYLANPGRLASLPSGALADINSDFEGFILQLNFLAEQALLITKSPLSPRVDRFRTSEVMNKCANTFRREAKIKLVAMHLVTSADTSPEYRLMSGDRTMIQQMLHSLLSNAIKCCYKGTKISVDSIYSLTPFGEVHALRVRYYGTQFDKDSRPYEIVTDQEGLGMGLYVANRVAIAHGGRLEIEQRQVSPYNVVLKKPYLALSSTHSNPQLADQIRHDMERLENAGEMSDILAVDQEGIPLHSVPMPREITNSIARPTWKVTFMACIPIEVIEK